MLHHVVAGDEVARALCLEAILQGFAYQCRSGAPLRPRERIKFRSEFLWNLAGDSPHASECNTGSCGVRYPCSQQSSPQIRGQWIETFGVSNLMESWHN